MRTRTKEEVSQLALDVKSGNMDAFMELEVIAKPLLVSLSNRFSKYHYRFEFDDFYSIGLHALYKACLSYNDNNPSFLDYAKIFIVRDFCHEVKYWNAKRRSIFDNEEVVLDSQLAEEYFIEDSLGEEIFKRDFRRNIESIIDECFDRNKARIMRMHIIDDFRISDIANQMGLKYKNVYSTVERGTKRIIREYVRRHIP